MIRVFYDDYNATESEMQTETETEIAVTSSIQMTILINPTSVV